MSPSWTLEPCRACDANVVRREMNPDRKGLCKHCWDNPLKRAAALFGDDPEEDPDGLPALIESQDNPSPGTTQHRPSGYTTTGMTGMYVTETET